jgi:hypothetical protein
LQQHAEKFESGYRRIRSNLLAALDLLKKLDAPCRTRRSQVCAASANGY